MFSKWLRSIPPAYKVPISTSVVASASSLDHQSKFPVALELPWVRVVAYDYLLTEIK